MAKTITLTSYSGSQSVTTKAGKSTYRHVLSYPNSKGEVTDHYIYAGNPLYDKLSKFPLTSGQTVDIQQEKKGDFWNIVDIAKAGSLPQTAATSKTSSKSNWIPNPDKDLSMELGGLMHDVVTLIAAGDPRDVEILLTVLYKAKQKVSRAIKDNNVDTIYNSDITPPSTYEAPSNNTNEEAFPF